MSWVFSYKNHNTKVLSGGKVFQAHKDVLLVPGTQPVGPKPFENSIFRQKQACWIADVERPTLKWQSSYTKISV